MKKAVKKKNYVIGLAMFALGIMLVLYLFRDIDSWKSLCPAPVTVQAVVSGNSHQSDSYYPYVRFELDDKEYEVLLDNSYDTRYSSPVAEGTLMTISVNSRRPDVVLKSPDAISFVVGMLAFVVSSLGFAIVLDARGVDTEINKLISYSSGCDGYDTDHLRRE